MARLVITMVHRHPGPLKSETFIPWDNCRVSGIARGIEVSLNFWKAVDGMEIWITVLLFLLGLLLIIKGGDWFLDGAVWIAEATGVPRFIIGATIVSLATTLPAPMTQLSPIVTPGQTVTEAPNQQSLPICTGLA